MASLDCFWVLDRGRRAGVRKKGRAAGTVVELVSLASCLLFVGMSIECRWCAVRDWS